MAKKPRSASAARVEPVAAEPEPEVPERFWIEANSYVFPNGERDFGHAEVRALARELFEAERARQ